MKIIISCLIRLKKKILLSKNQRKNSLSMPFGISTIRKSESQRRRNSTMRCLMKTEKR